MIFKNSKVLGGILLLVFIAAYSYYQNRSVSYEYYAKDFLLREKQVLAYLKLGEALAESERLDDLPKLFNEAISLQLIDWYQLSFEGSPVFFSPPEMRNFDLPQQDGVFQITEKYSFQTIDLGQGYFLTVGVNRDPEWYASHILKKYWDVLTQDILVVTAFAMFLLSFFIRDLLRTFQSFRQKKGKFRRRGLTSEAALIEKSMSSLYYGIQSMDQEREKLRSQVLPSLRTEIFSGLKPPYEFDCVLMRTDITGFSEMFLSDQKEQLMKEVLRVFRQFSLMAARYGGLIHEFIGDEVIVYFKEKDHENAVASALALLRDFHDFLNETSFLKVKSSLSQGSLYFSEHVQGFNLSGAVLIETVRLLSLAQRRKDSHQVYCSKEVMTRSPEWAHFEMFSEEKLKGFSRAQRVFSLKSFSDMSSRELIVSRFMYHKDPVKHLEKVFSEELSESDLRKIRKSWKMRVPEPLSEKIFLRLKDLVSSAGSALSRRQWVQFVMGFELQETQLQQILTELRSSVETQELFSVRHVFLNQGLQFDFKLSRSSFGAKLIEHEKKARQALSEDVFDFYKRSLSESVRTNRILIRSYDDLIAFWKKSSPGELLDFRQEQAELEALIAQAAGSKLFPRYQKTARPSTSMIKSAAS
jgi:class 3 adenylate cyclase